MSTTEHTGIAKKNAIFQKRDYRPWTVDVLEHTLDEDYISEDHLDESPLRPWMLDAVQPLPAAQPIDPRPILIGSFLDTALLCVSRPQTFSPRPLSVNHTGAQMQAKEETTLLQQRIDQLELMLNTERELRMLLEEKISAYSS